MSIVIFLRVNFPFASIVTFPKLPSGAESVPLKSAVPSASIENPVLETAPSVAIDNSPMVAEPLPFKIILLVVVPNVIFSFILSRIILLVELSIVSPLIFQPLSVVPIKPEVAVISPVR